MARMKNDTLRFCIPTESLDSWGKSLRDLNEWYKTNGDKKYVDLTLKAIYPNEKKGIVVVKFADNTTIKLKCQEEDEFDVYIATALAIAYKQNESRTHFKKVVDKLTVQPKEPKEKKEKEVKND